MVVFAAQCALIFLVFCGLFALGNIAAIYYITTISIIIIYRKQMCDEQLRFDIDSTLLSLLGSLSARGLTSIIALVFAQTKRTANISDAITQHLHNHNICIALRRVMKSKYLRMR